MAKTKKNPPNIKLRKVTNGNVKKYGIKNCEVKLRRLTKRECESYSKSNIIITKSFEIKIRGHSAEINGCKQNSSNNTFTFELKGRGADVRLESSVEQKKIQETNAKMAEPTVTSKICQTKTIAPKLLVKTLTVMINDAWTKSKREFKLSGLRAEQNRIVMAKMSGYSAWPGRIVDFTKNGKRAHIYFFGSNNNGSVSITEIVPFEQCHEVTRLLLLRKMGQFYRSVIEVERFLGIPDELSITRERFAIEN